MWAISPGTARTTNRTAAAATRPASWLFARIASMMAVRDPDADAAKPPSRPEATLTAPSARNSRLGSISWPLRTAKARPVSATSV